MIVHASTAERALSAALVLETLCRQYLLARSAGAVRLLTTEEMRGAHDRFRTYGQPSHVHRLRLRLHCDGKRKVGGRVGAPSP